MVVEPAKRCHWFELVGAELATMPFASSYLPATGSKPSKGHNYMKRSLGTHLLFFLHHGMSNTSNCWRPLVCHISLTNIAKKNGIVRYEHTEDTNNS